jgi:diaminopropionate ammonia-lyase
VSGAYDVFCAIEDSVAVAGMLRLASLGLEGGECSGAAVGAAEALLADGGARAALGAGPDSSVLVLLTEGVTDPEAYERLIG